MVTDVQLDTEFIAQFAQLAAAALVAPAEAIIPAAAYGGGVQPLEQNFLEKFTAGEVHNFLERNIFKFNAHFGEQSFSHGALEYLGRRLTREGEHRVRIEKERKRNKPALLHRKSAGYD